MTDKLNLWPSDNSRSNWNLEVLVFKERGKTEYPEKKPLGARTRTNTKLNPHIMLSPGIEPGPHWLGGGGGGGVSVLSPLCHPCPPLHIHIPFYDSEVRGLKYTGSLLTGILVIQINSGDSVQQDRSTLF